MSWTDERVDLLKSMWNEGKSASQIAKALGGVTRNAVIGKVHRLGLSNRTNGAAGKDEARPAAAAPPPPEETPVTEEIAPSAPAAEDKQPVAETRPGIREAVPGRPAANPSPPQQPTASDVSSEALANLAVIESRARKLNLMQLTERTCKWPIGDPATEEFWFCGLPAAPGKPYCEAHVAVAFQPMSSRRDRRASGR
ncbi:MAG: GcrA family cell cycle regulator [Pseudomonadota bacterium]